ncbi:hypothetical protein VPX56_10365 [Enterobacter wuhouensis]|uniref:Uncharacterized protein n=1 Tax=Enterobacter wuhouensis TaxID=2529381 RepID=A0ABZ1DQ41_9ENTR|nr:hypothetical protein [Enterobacter wuhouensis]MCV2531992.1 hypothetical protein [Enterobacter wuhouensis]WRW33476.1 hypothetical protein VPX56_10365 [Enterobacter wuhouensis]
MPDLKVINLASRKDADLEHNRTEVIRLLEEALHAAREGNYRSLAILLIDESGAVMDAWHSGSLPYVMVGAIESLKTDFINLQIERR